MVQPFFFSQSVVMKLAIDSSLVDKKHTYIYIYTVDFLVVLPMKEAMLTAVYAHTYMYIYVQLCMCIYVQAENPNIGVTSQSNIGR